MKTPTEKTSAPELITETDPLEWVSSHWPYDELGEPTGMIAMTSVFRLREVIASAVELELNKSGITTTDYLTLMTIRLSKDGVRPLSHIARAMMVHPTTVTQAIDRLELRKLVKRQPHPTDRRTTLATLTAAGQRMCREGTDSLREIEFGMPGVGAAELYTLISVIAPIRTAAHDVQPAPGAKPGRSSTRKTK